MRAVQSTTTMKTTMKTTTTPKPLYQHPDGFELLFGVNSLMMTDPDGDIVVMPIGAPELLKLGQSLIHLANTTTSTDV